jgi:hypothetical protein
MGMMEWFMELPLLLKELIVLGTHVVEPQFKQ